MKKLSLRLIVLTALAGAGTLASPPALASTSDWNQYQHDAAHTGSSPVHGPTQPGVLPGWPAPCIGCGSGPVLVQVGAADGSQTAAFTGSGEALVHGLGIDGQPLAGWPAPLTPETPGAVGFPAVDKSRTSARIFAAAWGDASTPARVYGLNEDGQPLSGAWPWQAPVGMTVMEPPLALAEDPQGDPSRTTLYVASGNAFTTTGEFAGYLDSLSMDGSSRAGWPVRLDGAPWFFNGPAVAPGGGTIYVVLEHFDWLSGRHSVSVAAYLPDGSRKAGWPVNLSAGEDVTSLVSAPAVGGDGTLYVPISDTTYDEAVSGWVYAIAPDGATKPGWPVRTQGVPLHAPVLASNGTVYVSAFKTDTETSVCWSYVYAIDAEGRTRPGWPVAIKTSCDNPFLGWDAAIYGMASDAASNVYFGSRDTAYGYAPDGRALPGWPLRIASDRALRYPALAANGTLYFLAYRAGNPFDPNRLMYAIGKSHASPHPKPKLPYPRKKKIDPEDIGSLHPEDQLAPHWMW